MSPILEAAMLAAFSVSWYCSIWKMLRTGQAAGKSLGFVVLICCGYLCGIASKLVLHHETGVWSELILLYLWNLLVTALDAWLVLRFTRPRNRPGPAATHPSHWMHAFRAFSPGVAWRGLNDPASKSRA